MDLARLSYPLPGGTICSLFSFSFCLDSRIPVPETVGDIVGYLMIVPSLLYFVEDFCIAPNCTIFIDAAQNFALEAVLRECSKGGSFLM